MRDEVGMTGDFRPWWYCSRRASVGELMILLSELIWVIMLAG